MPYLQSLEQLSSVHFMQCLLELQLTALLRSIIIIIVVSNWRQLFIVFVIVSVHNWIALA